MLGLPLQPLVPPESRGKDSVRGGQAARAGSQLRHQPRSPFHLPALGQWLRSSGSGQGMGELVWTALFF